MDNSERVFLVAIRNWQGLVLEQVVRIPNSVSVAIRLLEGDGTFFPLRAQAGFPEGSEDGFLL
jgi:hypothetical protein